MFSQSLFAQLMRMTLLLGLSLVVVHHSPKLLELLAQQAINSGCHQTTGGEHDHSHHHHH
ncbi:hypothetical protein VIOR3934_20706 [Vibrio orientalis CIP 102891 = ATCC 33934]|uniref:Uncharacterized protein n=1 Tax=Vibrio orientalis CIP 102891 = ATCC 33934 TaxID=675816 RepID=C9QES5_VIBOR|nr:hypothetical protein [Vibrio orientalis]EEX94635.1 hypothetical protein VIA_001795 [Vibrio orientalis CIP 102891 = ATCC 33934]EGU51332.1 hypothetical protein VIOR3934_20706 [Vibrio orientalis CIP 102891 = ATCC 33934]